HMTIGNRDGDLLIIMRDGGVARKRDGCSRWGRRIVPYDSPSTVCGPPSGKGTPRNCLPTGGSRHRVDAVRRACGASALFQQQPFPLLAAELVASRSI